jgi:hypothetical protein
MSLSKHCGMFVVVCVDDDVWIVVVCERRGLELKI